MSRPPLSIHRPRSAPPQFVAAAAAIQGLAQTLNAPFHRRPPPGFLRGIDFYSGFDLLHAMANGMEKFHAAHGRYPDLLDPRSYPEKVFWRKFLALTKVPESGDKLAHGHFIPGQLKSVVLLPEVVWRSAVPRLPDNREIEPGWYFLKASHGSRMNAQIRFPLSAAERQELNERAARWLDHAYGYGDGEWWYSLVPRRIFLERSLSGPDPIVTWDCTVVNGVLAGVCAVKRIGLTSHIAWLREDLSVHDFQDADEYAVVSPELPKDASGFRDIVLVLARPFNFVRVDLYLVGDRIYLSEFTLSPGNALMGRPPDFDRHLSGLWKILE
ncbi:hypothetical protein STAQ_15960 [Allostella sp. ATCC 35155]|nr:hypothetical protein STAQ_15960 [Stella sp. ATCC 35155]